MVGFGPGRVALRSLVRLNSTLIQLVPSGRQGLFVSVKAREPPEIMVKANIWPASWHGMFIVHRQYNQSHQPACPCTEIHGTETLMSIDLVEVMSRTDISRCVHLAEIICRTHARYIVHIADSEDNPESRAQMHCAH